MTVWRLLPGPVSSCVPLPCPRRVSPPPATPPPAHRRGNRPDTLRGIRQHLPAVPAVADTADTAAISWALHCAMSSLYTVMYLVMVMSSPRRPSRGARRAERRLCAGSWCRGCSSAGPGQPRAVLPRPAPHSCTCLAAAWRNQTFAKLSLNSAQLFFARVKLLQSCLSGCPAPRPAPQATLVRAPAMTSEQ